MTRISWLTAAISSIDERLNPIAGRISGIRRAQLDRERYDLTAELRRLTEEPADVDDRLEAIMRAEDARVSRAEEMRESIRKQAAAWQKQGART